MTVSDGPQATQLTRCHPGSLSHPVFLFLAQPHDDVQVPHCMCWNCSSETGLRVLRFERNEERACLGRHSGCNVVEVLPPPPKKKKLDLFEVFFLFSSCDFRSKYTFPTVSEGFSAIVLINFSPEFTDEASRKCYMRFSGWFISLTEIHWNSSWYPFILGSVTSEYPFISVDEFI